MKLYYKNRDKWKTKLNETKVQVKWIHWEHHKSFYLTIYEIETDVSPRHIHAAKRKV